MFTKNSFKSFPLSIPTVEIIGKSAVMIIVEYAKSRELYGQLRTIFFSWSGLNIKIPCNELIATLNQYVFIPVPLRYREPINFYIV